MTVFDVDIDALTGGAARLDQYRGSAVLVVNVAGKCGMAPRYAGLQALWTTKVEVNGPGRHPLHKELIGDGEDIRWNFEKSLVGPAGQVAGRFEPGVPPDHPELVAAVEKLLPR